MAKSGTTRSKKRESAMMSTSSSMPKRLRASDGSAKPVAALGDNGDKTDTEDPAVSTKGAQIGRHLSARSSGSRKAIGRAEDKEAAELDREGVTVVRETSNTAASGTAKGKVPSGKGKGTKDKTTVVEVADDSDEESDEVPTGKGKATKGKGRVVEVAEDSEDELGEYSTCCGAMFYLISVSQSACARNGPRRFTPSITRIP